MFCDETWPVNICGMTLEEATVWLNLNSPYYKSVRPVEIDGKTCITTADYQADRINVSIKEDKIYKLCGNG